jgi:hypothetical protein
MGDFNAFVYVLQCPFADGRVGISERTVLVDLVLKDIWVNCAETHSVLPRRLLNRANAGNSLRETPQNMQGDGRADTLSECTCPASLNFSLVAVAAAG